jgi:hypothetical protein
MASTDAKVTCRLSVGVAGRDREPRSAERRHILRVAGAGPLLPVPGHAPPHGGPVPVRPQRAEPALPVADGRKDRDGRDPLVARRGGDGHPAPKTRPKGRDRFRVDLGLLLKARHRGPRVLDLVPWPCRAPRLALALAKGAIVEGEGRESGAGQPACDRRQDHLLDRGERVAENHPGTPLAGPQLIRKVQRCGEPLAFRIEPKPSFHPNTSMFCLTKPLPG